MIPCERWRKHIDADAGGCIGVDGTGSSDTDDAGKYGVIEALCDIDSNRLNKKGAKFPNAAKFSDYREMFEALGDKVDAVTVSTPDHSSSATFS